MSRPRRPFGVDVISIPQKCSDMSDG
jgi:hypothetical protein